MQQMARHFEAVWRLTNQGEWVEVQRGEAGAQGMSGTLELFASMCAESWGEGAEVTARVGSKTLIARRDERGVLVGLARATANPVMIRAAMSRLEQTSMRMRQSQRVTWSSREVSSGQAWQGPATPVSAPFEVAEGAAVLDFDAFLSEEPSVAQSAPEAQLCSWEEAARYVEQTLGLAAELVGRTVAANYWREALRVDERVAGAIELDLRGRVTVRDGERRLDMRAAQSLDEALVRWVARCRRVIPNMEQLMSRLDSPAWRR
jgi:hypothetical protein